MLQIDTTSGVKALQKLKESSKEKLIIMYSLSLSLCLSQKYQCAQCIKY